MNQHLYNDLNAIDTLLQSTMKEGLKYLKQLNELPTSVATPGIEETELPLSSSGGKLSGILQTLSNK